MESKEPPLGNEHAACEVVWQCAAVLRDPGELGLSRIRSLPVVVMLCFLGLLWASSLWSAPALFCWWPCSLFLIVPGALLLVFVFRPWMAQPGQLVLRSDALLFQRSGKPTIQLILSAIERIGRKRNRIHVVIKNRSAHYYFSCSRLHGEDMYDQILDQLDHLGIDVVSHERRR